ncbi:hypothetical protein D3C72_2439660 [compost metagenome]
MELAAGLGLDGAFDGAFEPVPVPQRDEQEDGGEEEDEDGEPTLSTFAGTTPAPTARHGGWGRGVDSVHVLHPSLFIV